MTVFHFLIILRFKNLEKPNNFYKFALFEGTKNIL